MTNSTDAKPLDAAELAEIRARAEKATPGPWSDHNWDEMEKPHVVAVQAFNKSDHCHGQADVPRTRDDAYFIARSRDDIPRLLATLDSLTARSSEVSDEEAESWLAALEIGPDEQDDPHGPFTPEECALGAALFRHTQRDRDAVTGVAGPRFDDDWSKVACRQMFGWYAAVRELLRDAQEAAAAVRRGEA